MMSYKVGKGQSVVLKWRMRLPRLRLGEEKTYPVEVVHLIFLAKIDGWGEYGMN